MAAIFKMIFYRNKGFTLIELLVVIAIIGLLASVVLVSMQGARENARQSRAKEDLSQISKAIEIARFKADKVLLQITGSGCSECACRNQDLISPNAACINSMTNAFSKIGLPLLKDPYGSPYLIDENELEVSCSQDSIWSAGPDRRSGVGGDDILIRITLYSPSCF